MKTNFDTKMMITLNYHGNSGGKFIGNCLAIGEKFLHQHEHLAKAKMKLKWDQQESFRVSHKVMEDKKFYQRHLEFGCYKLAGRVLQPTKELQEELTTDWFKWLTHQDEYYFFMVVPFGSKNNIFNDSIDITLKNYEWILKDRNTLEKDINSNTAGKGLFFDMNTIHNETEFGEAINNLSTKINGSLIRLDLLESMRKTFLETYRIGF